MKNHCWISIIATLGFIGKVKYIPGTFGSLAAFPLIFIINIILNFFSIKQATLQYLIIQIIIITLLFIVGCIASDYYSKTIAVNDPKEVIIDEVVGQLLVINLTFLSVIFIQNSNIPQYFSVNVINIIFNFILPFFLFRLFDILKPWPINWCDQNIKGGFGIMFDDIVAALFAVVCDYGITFIFIDLLEV